MRWMAVFVSFGFVACGGEEGGSSNVTSENCSSEWSCENGVCECADGSSCTDEESCDAECEICT